MDGPYLTSLIPIVDAVAASASPGPGALPGAGCGYAVDIAVWNEMLPSTLRST
jgi:hypothetical protein